MTDKIDLHTHSTASDGTLSPGEVAERAKANGLRAVALTDHDTVGGVTEFLAECESIGIEGIAGVEISAQHDKTMHIVGLFIDHNNRELNEKLARLRGGREVRNRKMLSLLQEGGFDITEEDIIKQKDGATMTNTGRAHIARAMVKKGYVKDTSEAFNRYIKRGNPYYVKRLTYSPRESIDMIHAAGGVAILAHPILISEDYDTLLPIVKEMKECGMDGMECYYNNYTPEFAEMCLDMCKELDLLPSGGSDFHGANKPTIELGEVSTGYVPYEVLEKMKSKRKGTVRL